MWLWEPQLKRLGFRRCSSRYWQCGRGYGLPADAYLSAFLHTAAGNGPRAYEFTGFHVTFCRNGHRLHFYFHEAAEFVWTTGGHTSRAELAALDLDSATLRDDAIRIAREFINQAGGSFSSSDEP